MMHYHPYEQSHHYNGGNIATRHQSVHINEQKFLLVCTSHKVPVVASDFDRSYLKNYFEFLKSVKGIL